MEELKIVAVRKDGSEIAEYKLSNGTVIDKQLAAMYVMDGTLSGYMLGQSKYGEFYLRSAADGDPNNNLSELPEF